MKIEKAVKTPHDSFEGQNSEQQSQWCGRKVKKVFYTIAAAEVALAVILSIPGFILDNLPLEVAGPAVGITGLCTLIVTLQAGNDQADE